MTRGEEKRSGCLKRLLIALIVVVVLAVVAVWAVKAFVFPSEFKPVVLKAQEGEVLNDKIDKIGLGVTGRLPGRSGADDDAPLEPEPYSESDADRTVRLSEKELNALLANNTNLAKRVAIDLSQDLMSAKILLPMEEDFPVLGGKTLRVNAGLEISFESDRPVVRLKGVSLMGVPLPNSWLGGIKNMDLVEEYGGDQGFWRSFSDGVDDLKVEDGQLTIRLKE